MVRAVLREALPNVSVKGTFAEKIKEMKQHSADIVVLKTHPRLNLMALLEHIRAPVLLSVRDPRDCVASWMQMSGQSFDSAQYLLMRTCAAALQLAPRSQVLRYEDGTTESIGAVMRIAEYLGLALSEPVAEMLTRELSFGAVEETIAALSAATPQ
jgi:hypothetical protein